MRDLKGPLNQETYGLNVDLDDITITVGADAKRLTLQIERDVVARARLRLVLAAGELDRRGPHQMRHTFASLLFAGGRPDYLRQPATRTQGRVDHAAGVRALVAGPVEREACRRARRQDGHGRPPDGP
jgi:integrase